MEELLVKIEQLLPDLNHTERKIAEFILNNPYLLLQLPIKKLSEDTEVSQAAWVRFFKLLGYSGLKQFKREISSSLCPTSAKELAAEAVFTDTFGANSPEELCKSVLEQNTRSVTETAQILDYRELKKAVNAICQAEKIAFFGVGASGLVAYDAQCKFTRIGINAIFFLDLHLQLPSASTLRKGDVAVVISNSGRTRDTLDVMEIAKSKGATIVAITKYGKNPLSKAADILLNTSTPEINIRSSATGSRMAQLMVIDFLFACTANKEFDKIEKYLHESRETVDCRKI
ncbi:MAG: MurR/RpiR family transcriptional regulator [Oscillospiraceae bacterium]